MLRKIFIRVVLTLVLAAWTTLASAPAVAAQRSPRTGAVAADLWAQAWTFLQQLAGLTVLRGEEGWMIDPNGTHMTAATPAAPAAGLTALRGEQGIGIDPDGSRLTTAAPPAATTAGALVGFSQDH